jgi:hypothetical protein
MSEQIRKKPVPKGVVRIEFQPGDATRYDIVILIDEDGQDGIVAFAVGLGCHVEWEPDFIYEPLTEIPPYDEYRKWAMERYADILKEREGATNPWTKVALRVCIELYLGGAL